MLKRESLKYQGLKSRDDCFHEEHWTVRERLCTCNVSFAPALSRVLVARRAADGASVAAVTATAAVRVRGFKAVPTGQTVGTAAARRPRLTLTLTSDLQARSNRVMKVSNGRVRGLTARQQPAVCSCTWAQVTLPLIVPAVSQSQG